MVTRHHDGADAGVLQLAHDLSGVWPQGVGHHCQPHQVECCVPLCVLLAPAQKHRVGDQGHIPLREGQHSQAFSRVAAQQCVKVPRHAARLYHAAYSLRGALGKDRGAVVRAAHHHHVALQGGRELKPLNDAEVLAAVGRLDVGVHVVVVGLSLGPEGRHDAGNARSLKRRISVALALLALLALLLLHLILQGAVAAGGCLLLLPLLLL
mmetsp:Transcript_29272/g.64756  ORF Transcript_29272/g.64756 Transcript_29272/m.64756 type:complete len:209 (+) Transcript_29272:2452-3078(+)